MLLSFIRHMALNELHCMQCGKVFRTSYHLRRHLASHSTEKTATCAVCRKTFAQAEYLALHMVGTSRSI